MARRKVPIEQKAEAVALALVMGNTQAAERQAGFSDTAIHNWAKLTQPDFVEIVERKRREIGGGFLSLTEKLLARAHAEHEQVKITDRNFVPLLGVSADKGLIYNNQPNQITETRAIDVTAIALATLAALLSARPELPEARARQVLLAARPEWAEVLRERTE